MRQILILLVLLFCCRAYGQQAPLPGAERLGLYLSALKGKNIALVANHASLVGPAHLVDTLLRLGVKIQCVFAPEHGFRGNADAGAEVASYRDKATGISVVSLYGKSVKPTQKDMQGLDLVVFDLQDVGVRFYTYLSCLHYVMEACAENRVPLLVLDRPNPNGFYIDGPVLDSACQSYVGLHPVPVVYGMSIGEYARMINGEGWLTGQETCELSVIPCEFYTHSTRYRLPVKPSPNLPNALAVSLYPSLALFEGTGVSLGRGTTFPFEVYGSPEIREAPFRFTPRSITGMSSKPLHEGRVCFGWDLRERSEELLASEGKLDLSFLINAYLHTADKSSFFNSYFDLLAGSKELQQQIREGVPEETIRQSWTEELREFRMMRQKYLIYPDRRK